MNDYKIRSKKALILSLSDQVTLGKFYDQSEPQIFAT